MNFEGSTISLGVAFLEILYLSRFSRNIKFQQVISKYWISAKKCKTCVLSVPSGFLVDQASGACLETLQREILHCENAMFRNSRIERRKTWPQAE